MELDSTELSSLLSEELSLDSTELSSLLSEELSFDSTELSSLLSSELSLDSKELSCEDESIEELLSVTEELIIEELLSVTEEGSTTDELASKEALLSVERDKEELLSLAEEETLSEAEEELFVSMPHAPTRAVQPRRRANSPSLILFILQLCVCAKVRRVGVVVRVAESVFIFFAAQEARTCCDYILLL